MIYDLFDPPGGPAPFVRERLRLARALRGVTLERLGEDVAASPTLLSQVETGLRQPRPDLVAACAAALGFEPAFFAAPVLDPFTEAECSFRRRATTPKQLQKRALALGTLFGEVVSYLGARLALPAFDVPHASAATLEEAERAAERCRSHWGLGLDAPATSVGRALENAGVAIAQLDAGGEKVDAFSRHAPRHGAVSVIVLNTAKGSASRSRFDLAHELGHLAMHRGLTPDREAHERQADRFASAFLMPAAGFARDFQSAPLSWPHLFDLKAHWGASVAAVVRRASDLQLLDAAAYRRFNRALAKRGWHRGEPHEPEPERPELVPLAFDALERSTGERPADVARALAWRPETLAAVAGVSATRTGAGDDAAARSLDAFRERRAPRGPKPHAGTCR